MNPLHEQFVSEARELIQQATELVELPAMSISMHAAEDLVAAVQAGRVPASAAVITSALQCLDQVSQWIDAFEAHAGLPARAGEQAREMAETLRRHLRRETDGAPAALAVERRWC